MSIDRARAAGVRLSGLPMMNLFQRILLSFSAAILFQGVMAAAFMMGFLENVQSEYARKELKAEAHAVFEGLSAWKLELWKKVNELESDASLRRAVLVAPTLPHDDPEVLTRLKGILAGTSHDFAVLTTAGRKAYRVVDLSSAAPVSKASFVPLNERGHPFIDALELDGALHFVGAARIGRGTDGAMDIFLFKRIGEDIVSALSFNPKTGIVISSGFEHSTASHRAKGAAEAAILDLVRERDSGSAYFLEDDWQISREPFGLSSRQFGTVGIGAGRSKLWISTLLSKADYRAEMRRFNLVLMLVLVGLTFITILVSIAITRSVTSPVRKLCRGMRQVESGSLDVLMEGSTISEMDELLGGFNSMTERLRNDKAEIELSIARLVQAEKMASVGMLSAGVAHEVNNPLSSILTNVQNLLVDEEDAEKREVLALIESETKRIARIVRALLDFSSPRRGIVDLPSCSPVPVIEELISLLRYSLKNSRGIALELEAEGTELEIAMSADELKQILLNLLKNSFSAIGQEGRVLVRIGQKPQTREGGPAGPSTRRAFIEVVDTGAGIGPELLPRIFDPFFSTRPGSEGIGLGLSVVYGIVTERKGYIRAESEQGKGTRIIMDLPLVGDTPQTAAVAERMT